MSMPSLSHDAIKLIMTGKDYDKPILQVLGTKKLIGSGQERYRLLLSDGDHLNSFAMLATQLNHLCTDGSLTDLCIVRIDQYVNSSVSKVGNKRVLVVLGLTVLKTGSEVGRRIGNPQLFTGEETPNGTTESNGTSQAQKATTSTESKASSNSLYAGSNNMSQRSVINREFTFPISSLSPYQNKWVIKVRVTFKSPIRTWSNPKGEGKLFSMDLMDESGEIRATAFKEQCDKFYDLIEIDRVYYITKCALKTANKQYTTIKNDYEMTFTPETVVELCEDEESDGPIPKVKYNFLPIAKIADIEPKATVDVIGICRDAGEVQTFTSKTTNKEFTKREITLIDKSDAAVQLTLWGDDAIKFDEDLANTKAVILVKNARVSEFNGGKSLSNASGTILKINPDLIEGHQLRGWYDNGGASDNISSVSARTGGGNMSTQWLTFREVQDKNLGTGDKPDYFQIKAVVHYAKADKSIYKACPQENCNKKLVEEGENSYRCEKCDALYADFKWRLLLNVNIGDWTGNRYITCFHEVGEQLLGHKVDDIAKLLQAEDPAANEIFSNVTYRAFVFKIRSKVEVYGDVNRNKFTAMSVTPVNHKEYNKYLIENISRLTGIGKV